MLTGISIQLVYHQVKPNTIILNPPIHGITQIMRLSHITGTLLNNDIIKLYCLPISNHPHVIQTAMPGGTIPKHGVFESLDNFAKSNF